MERKEIYVGCAVVVGAFLLYVVYRREQAAHARSAAQQSQDAMTQQINESSAQYAMLSNLPQISLPSPIATSQTTPSVAVTSDSTHADTTDANSLLGQILATFASNVTPAQSASVQSQQALIAAIQPDTIHSSQTVAGQTQSGAITLPSTPPVTTPPVKTLAPTAAPAKPATPVVVAKSVPIVSTTPTSKLTQLFAQKPVSAYRSLPA